jgi:pyrroloquinoline quinone biosynthesis protein B
MRATKQKTTTFILLFTSILIFSLSVESKSPYLFVLGVGQDGGAPQAGCFSSKCVSEWKKNQKVFPTSLALIDPVGKKYLFEATPNLPEQMVILEKEAPSNQFLLDGVFITHAHIGHYAGLIFFGREVMGSKRMPLYLMPEMENFIRSNGPWSQLVKLRK